ncbi:HlyD family efflux transporter periplasmic adaptor subunit [Acinetobacter sp. B10A]|uniref:HlyD family efflux transporter periplasmic adaptor subunit n=1 Tax=Acinetobacter baretiae TaxID=2605383 RepID=UPI001B3C4EC5|nr:HlyD family efflux transporter periplasmic adaptor subunit [Acinetobacter baretiae]MBF7684821.1 HlyD family efflux transporter periplasmic adaptor subunit [Acinetobacter baretiae]
MSEQSSHSEHVSTSSTQSNPQKRKKLLLMIAIIFMISIVMYAIWLVFFNGTEDTDNAYVAADTAQISAMVGGQVLQVLTQDTAYVHAGDILVKIDDQDAQIAVAQAQAELTKVKRQFGQTQANSGALNSQIQATDDAIQSQRAQVEKAQADLAKVKADFKRREVLNASGAISKEEYTTSLNALNTAKAGLSVAEASLQQALSNQKVAQSNLEANNALIKGTTQETTPDVLAAQSKLDQAKLNLERTIVRAPVDGIVTNRNVQIGQVIAAGQALMIVVPIHQMYVNANFKESQLARVKVGQNVKLTSDLYGNDVVYQGKVVGFSGGTGAAFALIPAQNATGNWIKVVQRLPVRIALDPNELNKHPLRVGLSMNVKVELK